MPGPRESPHGTPRSVISLRGWAVLLVLAAALPLLIFAWFTLDWMARSHADAFRKRQTDAVRGLAGTVDSELRSWKAALTALASSQALREGRLAAFYAEARAVAAQQDGWINLIDPAGHQHLNTLRPYGTRLPDTAAMDLVRTIFTTRRPAVGDLVFGNGVQRWALGVAVPVVREGTVVFMLNLVVTPDRLTQLLQRQELPVGWTAAIVDGQRKVVTRLPLTAEQMGKPVPPWFAAALGTVEHGVAEGMFADGVPGRVAFSRVAEAPWVVTLGVPFAAVPSARPVHVFLALGVLLGLAAIALAVVASRKLTGAVTAVADNAERMLRGEPVAPIASPTSEVQRLQEALAATADHARALHEAVARAAVAQELRESEALLRAVTDTSPDAIYIKDRESRWLLANPALLRIIGKPAAEAVGKTDLELYADPAIGQAILANDRRILASGRPEVFEEVADTPEGRRTFLSIKAPRRDAAGAVIGIIGISHDITDRMAAEAARRDSEERFRVLSETSPIGVGVSSADGVLLYANPAYELLLGFDRGELLGKKASDLYLNPDDRTSWLGAMKEGGAVRNVELRLKRKDCVPVWVSINVSHIYYNGKQAVMGTIQDITERKQAEAEVKSVARFPEENPSPVLRVTPEGTLLYANRASAPLLHAWQCQVGQRLPADWCARVGEVAARGTVTEIEVPFDGDRVYSYIVTPIPEAAYLNIYARDISARKRAEAALRELNQELETTVQARTAELARQTDQLRTLAAELTLAEQRERRRLADVLHDEHQQLLVAAMLRMNFLQRTQDPEVRDACQEATALLQEVIEHSRSLVRDLSPPLLQTGGLVPALTWLARWMGEQHRLAVEVRADPTVAPATEELTILLYQAVRELLLNVVKHAQVAAARLSVTTEDGQVRIVVEDAGAGFDPAGLRAEGGATGGFGLFSIQQRLPLLGGRLEIVSAPDQGSRFTLWAPLRPVEVPQAALGGEPRPAPAAARTPGAYRTLRLVLVDDHAVVRQSMARLLNLEPDLEVVGEAADGKQAIQLAAQLHPDIVLMDISMPVLNGIEATRAIRAQFPHIQVIGLSMYEDVEQATAMKVAGAAQYVSKSSPTEILLAAIRAAATRRPSF